MPVCLILQSKTERGLRDLVRANILDLLQTRPVVPLRSLHFAYRFHGRGFRVERPTPGNLGGMRGCSCLSSWSSLSLSSLRFGFRVRRFVRLT
jgi:hypothetical protein